MRRQGVWLEWTLATAGAETIGYAAAAVLFGLPAGPILAGMVEGTLLGLAQAAVLRRRLRSFPGATWWLLTAVVATAGWGSTSAFGGAEGGAEPGPWLTALLGAGLGVGMGVLMGAGQWLVLRRRLAPAWRWIPASALGWGLGMVPAMEVAALPATSPGVFGLLLLGAVGGFLMGAAVGLVTGWQLVRLVPAPPNRVVSPASD